MAKLTQTTKAPAKTTATKTAPVKTVPVKKAETKEANVQTFYAPSNPPTAGRYLFAFTAAAMDVVMALPKAKQQAAAGWFHGATAMRHHGADGTRRIVKLETGGMKYDTASIKVGPQCTDEKRRDVPASFVTAFATFFKTGEFPKTAQDGFAFKASGKKTLNVSI
jgi:hypothetical protein